LERAKFPSLRYGRQYQRPISNFGADFALPLAGELIAWSHILDDEEALCVVNGHAGKHEAAMRPWTWLSILLLLLAIDGMGQHHSVANSFQASAGSAYTGTHPVGSRVAVSTRNGAAFLAIRDVPPSEVLVLINRI
jgi:hypothetical protein